MRMTFGVVHILHNQNNQPPPPPLYVLFSLLAPSIIAPPRDYAIYEWALYQMSSYSNINIYELFQCLIALKLQNINKKSFYRIDIDFKGCPFAAPLTENFMVERFRGFSRFHFAWLKSHKNCFYMLVGMDCSISVKALAQARYKNRFNFFQS